MYKLGVITPGDTLPGMKQTMRAMVADGCGGPEVLKLKQIPRPEPGPGQALLRVRASSVNPIDTKIRRGALAHLAPDPMILGCDAAGKWFQLGPMSIGNPGTG